MSDNSQTRILLVDDDALLLKSIQGILQFNSFQVDIAQSPDEGMQKMAANQYDFIFCDYKMPDHDGIWFMRHADIPRGTKVLLMTAYVNRDVINEMFSLGIVGYIIKPFGEDEILRHISFHSRGETPPQL
jgi:DNA-binding response OmpR family regulator